MKSLSLIVVALSLSATGCSKEQLKGSAYETLRNIELRECQQSNPTQCQRGEDYVRYQQRLKTLESDQ